MSGSSVSPRVGEGSQPKGQQESLVEYGETMRKNRVLLGLSIRDAAEKAGVSKNTILRLESGLPVAWQTHVKVSRAYGRVPARPESRKIKTVEGKHYRLQPLASRPWLPVKVEKDGNAKIFDSSESVDQNERNRMGWYGIASHFISPLRCRRESSRFIAMITEVFARTDITTDLSGERFLLGLRGRVRVLVGDEAFEMGEGEAATIDATLPNGVEPVAPVKPGEPAPLLLQVVLP